MPRQVRYRLLLINKIAFLKPDSGAILARFSARKHLSINSTLVFIENFANKEL